MSSEMITACQGHVGYTVNVVEVKGVFEIFAWSPAPGLVRPSDVELMFDNMMSSMSERREDWKYWYEFIQPKALPAVPKQEGEEDPIVE